MTAAPSRSFIYGLPRPVFFSQCHGVGGAIAHAVGMFDGLTRLGFTGVVLSGDVPEPDVFEAATFRSLGTAAGWTSRWAWNERFCKEAAKLAADMAPELFYLRYSVSFAPHLPRLRRLLPPELPLVVEVNRLGTQRIPGLGRVEGHFLKAATHVVGPTEQIKQWAAARLAGTRTTVLCLPNAVDITRFPAQRSPTNASLAGPLAAPKLGYFGLLKKETYNIDVLLRAMRLLADLEPAATLDIVGDGPALDHLQRLAASLRLSNTRFLGPAPRADVPGRLQHYDVLMNPGSASFQSPIKLFEYMAAARPILAARTAVTEALLEAPGCGLLYDALNAEDLVAKLRALCADGDLRCRLAARAREEAERHHTWDQRVRQLLAHMGTDTKPS
jgi:glycosyltransferase involved in cell wall biosynthesis